MEHIGQVVLVTGGNGFLGTALVAELVARGLTVHALVNTRQQFLERLLPATCVHCVDKVTPRIAEVVAEVNPATVFHLATVFKEPEAPPELEAMIEGNLTLGMNLLFAASQQTRPPAFVNAGTYWQFGDDPRRSPNSLYAATKQAFHNLMLYYRDRYSIPALTLVLYDTFGTNDPRPKLWSRLTSASPGTEIRLTQGDQIIHLVHAKDVMRALLRAAGLLHEGQRLDSIYSAHSLRPQTVKSLVTLLNDRAHLDLKLVWGAIDYPEHQIFHPWVGNPLPGWEPQIDVLDALVEHVSAHRSTRAVHGVHLD